MRERERKQARGTGKNFGNFKFFRFNFNIFQWQNLFLIFKFKTSKRQKKHGFLASLWSRGDGLVGDGRGVTTSFEGE